MSEPTTIYWLTLPRNGNGGCALVKYRNGTSDTMQHYRHADSLGYLLGDKPPRYPLPDTYDLDCKPPRYLFVGAWFIDWSRGYLEYSN